MIPARSSRSTRSHLFLRDLSATNADAIGYEHVPRRFRLVLILKVVGEKLHYPLGIGPCRLPVRVQDSHPYAAKYLEAVRAERFKQRLGWLPEFVSSARSKACQLMP